MATKIDVVIISDSVRIASVIKRSQYADFYTLLTAQSFSELKLLTVEKPLYQAAKVLVFDALNLDVEKMAEDLEYLDIHNLRQIYTVLMMANQSLVESLMPNWDVNDEWVLPTIKTQTLHYKLQHIAERANQRKKIIRDLNEASEIAVLSMSHSSELGEISRFILRSYECKDYNQLLDVFFAALRVFNISCSVLIVTNDSVITRLASDTSAEIRKKLLRFHSQAQEDFINSGADLMMRFPHAVMNFHDMPPEYDSRYDRLIDSLMTLANCLEARVRGIKAEEEATAANRAKTMFLATMSHELRTPMNSVIGFTERLIKKLDGRLNPKEESQLLAIKRNGDHLLRIINDILDMSKIEAGRMDITPEEVDSVALIDSIFNQLKPLANNQGIEFTFSSRLQALPIHVDPTRFTQMIMNIASNAIKYTPKGRVTMELDTCDDKALGSALRLKVIDTGIGISAEDQKRLFGNFVQIDSKLSRKVEGTGLGLAITLVFVSMHNGRIDVESELAKGSCFTLLLPLPDSALSLDIDGDLSAAGAQNATHATNNVSNTVSLLHINDRRRSGDASGAQV